MHNFRELTIWKDAMDLSRKVITITRTFPNEKKYGLVSQLNRAAISVPSNIAEGSSRDSDKDFARFISISLGSLFEVETQLILSKDFNYLSQESYTEILSIIHKLQKQIYRFKERLKPVPTMG